LYRNYGVGTLWKGLTLKKNYDFSNAIRNPYAKRLKKQLTIRLDEDTISYFQCLSREMSLPYQTLINMYLRDCAETRKRPHWGAPSSSEAGARGGSMPASRKQKDNDEMRPSYDFSKAVRAKYAARVARGTNVVVLAPDVAEAFKTSKAVNDALRSQLKSKPARRARRLTGR
jgi:predicted DNA binding CopG/RHH family protein